MWKMLTTAAIVVMVASPRPAANMQATRGVAAAPTPKVVALVGAVSSLTAQERPIPSVPPLVISSLAGRDLFQAYCATCHGRGGKGDGPVASSLKNRPADLTTIARRNGGRFPREQVERYVEGDELTTAAHGSGEMPVWGPIFRGLDPRDTVNRVRIANLVEFIESMQTE